MRAFEEIPRDRGERDVVERERNNCCTFVEALKTSKSRRMGAYYDKSSLRPRDEGGKILHRKALFRRMRERQDRGKRERLRANHLDDLARERKPPVVL